MRQRVMILAVAALCSFIAAGCAGTADPHSPAPSASAPPSVKAGPGLTASPRPVDPPSAVALPKPVCANGAPPPKIAQAKDPNDGVPDPTGRIVFGRLTRVDDLKGQIVSINAIDPDGSDLIQLLDCETARPRISPDGTRVAFAIVMDDGSFQVATMAIDGSDLRILTSTPGYAETPDWSPDGSWLIYSHAPKACPASFDDCVLKDRNLWNLWRMNADGSNQRRIGNPDTADWEPRLSPDGDEVVFTRFGLDDNLKMTLMIRNLATGKERVVTANDREPEHPDWTPDGRFIVYNTSHTLSGDRFEQLERVPATDPKAAPVVLYPGEQGGIKAAYSPDGTRIAFGSDLSLRLMAADGSSVVGLYDEAGVEINHYDWGVTPTTGP